MQKLLIHGTSVHVTFTLTLDITEVFLWSQYEQVLYHGVLNAQCESKRRGHA